MKELSIFAAVFLRFPWYIESYVIWAERSRLLHLRNEATFSIKSLSATKMHPNQGQMESFNQRVLDGLKVWWFGFHIALAKRKFSKKNSSWIVFKQLFRWEARNIVSDPLCFVLFLPEKENQTWNLQRAKNLQVTIVPSSKGQFWLLFWVTKLCPALCDPMDRSTPGFPVLHHLLEFAQIHVHWVSDAI